MWVSRERAEMLTDERGKFQALFCRYHHVWLTGTNFYTANFSAGCSSS